MKKRRTVWGKPGIGRQYLMDNYRYSEIPSYEDLKFGHVLYLFLEVADKKGKETREAIQATVSYPCTVIPNKIKLIQHRYKKFRSFKRKGEIDNFVKFCSTPFSSINPIQEITEAPSPDEVSDEDPTDTRANPAMEASVECEMSNQCPFPEPDPAPAPVSRRPGSPTPRELKMKERLEFISRNWRLQKDRFAFRNSIQRDTIRQKKEEIKNKSAKIVRLKKELKRVHTSIEELQQIKHKQNLQKDKNKWQEKKVHNSTEGTLKLKINISVKNKVIPCFESEQLQVEESVHTIDFVQ